MLYNRTKQELREELKALALSYTPEWNDNHDNPDIGTALADIFVDQLWETIRMYHTLPGKYEEELVRMLGITPEKPKPSSAVLVLQPSAGSDTGVQVLKGSRFFADLEERDTPVVFEAVHDLYVTNACITAAFAISKRQRKVIALCGSDTPFSYPISLFDFRKPVEYPNELHIYHPFLYLGDTLAYAICFGSEKLAEQLMDPDRFLFCYKTEKGRMPVRHIRRNKDQIHIFDGADSQILVIASRGNGDRELSFPRVSFLAGRQTRKPEFLHNGIQEIQMDTPAVFGEEPAVYSECYIGFTDRLIQKGTRIRVKFELDFGIKEVRNTLPEEEELRLIKRRPAGYKKLPADIYVQEAAVSYFNGKGFRRLPLRRDISALFAEEQNKGVRSLEFLCPEDWAGMELGGYGGYMIKLQVVRADNCYMRPARYHYPVLKNMELMYAYDQRDILPSRLVRRQGGTETDLTLYLHKNRPIPAFVPFPYQGEAVLLGLDKKPEKGPVSIYIVLRKNSNYQGLQTLIEYASPKGFAPLKAHNGTDDLKNSGTITFVPPADMSETVIEGSSGYWIRLTARKPGDDSGAYPVVEQIYMNGVEVQNIDRSKKKEYFIDSDVSDFSYPVAGNHVVEVKVCVKEKEADIYWEEAAGFDETIPGGRHYVLDRINKRLHFDDRIAARIQTGSSEAAFRMEVISCDGEEGNVPAGSIDSAAFQFRNVEKICNPLAASGGGALESQSSMNMRGRLLLGTGMRLVSAQDYISAAKAFSDQIARAWYRMEGRKITIAVLMKDYEAGPYSFQQIREPLKHKLLSMGPVTIRKEHLEIQEPVFIKVAVELWIHVAEWKQALEERLKILECIRGLFQPVKADGRGEPRLGYLPRESQVLMMVQAASSLIKIERYSMTASYVDQEGAHVTELNRLKRDPFMICVNGTHEVHV